MRTALFCTAALFFSCAHAPDPVPAVEEEAPLVCDKVPALVATRIPKPSGYPNCSTQTWRDSAQKACETDQFDACHLLATCLLVDSMNLQGEARRPYTEGMLVLLGKSCKAGMAESCTLRASVQVEAGVPAKNTCADFIRGAQLGDTEGYLSCMSTCLH